MSTKWHRSQHQKQVTIAAVHINTPKVNVKMRGRSFKAKVDTVNQHIKALAHSGSKPIKFIGNTY